MENKNKTIKDSIIELCNMISTNPVHKIEINGIEFSFVKKEELPLIDCGTYQTQYPYIYEVCIGDSIRTGYFIKQVVTHWREDYTHSKPQIVEYKPVYRWQ